MHCHQNYSLFHSVSVRLYFVLAKTVKMLRKSNSIFKSFISCYVYILPIFSPAGLLKNEGELKGRGAMGCLFLLGSFPVLVDGSVHTHLPWTLLGAGILYSRGSLLRE